MTTTITIETCDWPVEVRLFPLADRAPIDGAAWSEPQRLEPRSRRVFHIHDGVDLMVHELPLPTVMPAPDGDA